MAVRQLNTNETLWTWNLKLINRIIKVISIFFKKEKNHFFYCFADKLCEFCFWNYVISWFLWKCENYKQIKDIRIPRVSYSLFYRFEVPLLSIFAIRLKTILFFMFLIPTHFNTFRSNFKTRQKDKKFTFEGLTEKVAVLISTVTQPPHSQQLLLIIILANDGWQREKHPAEKLRRRVLGSFSFFEWRMSSRKHNRIFRFSVFLSFSLGLRRR